MNRNYFAWLLLGALTLSASAHADTTETVIGAAIGSATGAAIGKKAKNVEIWSALGGATGAYIGHRLGEQPRQPEVIVKERVRYVHDDDYVVVRRPAYVVYEEPRYYKVKHKHHHHHDWDDDD